MMSDRRRHARAVVGVILVVLAAACRADESAAPGPSTVAAVELSKATLALPLGGTAVLDVVARDASGNAVSAGDVHWSSSNTSVAKVSANGVITALAVGSATIAATVQGRSATAVLTVAPRPVASVRITPSALSLAVGQAASLAAAALDATGASLGNVSVAWRTNNGAVATVDANGRVTAVGGGATTIAATVGDITTLAAVAVSTPAPSVPTPAPTPTVGRVVVSPTLAALKWTGTRDRTVQLSATAYSSATGGSVVSGATFTWSTSDAAVANVSPTGLVTAIGTGAATITVRSGGASALAVITSSKK